MTEHKSRSLAMLLVASLWGCSLQAQESVNAAGGDATGSGGTIAYSLGHVHYTTNTGDNGSVAQGVQHTYDVSAVGVKEAELNIFLTAFPNPTIENLTLQISDYNKEKLSYQLYDMQGRSLINGQIVAQQTQINTSSLPPATYFIDVVSHKNKIVQSFKVIKK